MSGHVPYSATSTHTGASSFAPQSTRVAGSVAFQSRRGDRSATATARRKKATRERTNHVKRPDGRYGTPRALGVSGASGEGDLSLPPTSLGLEDSLFSPTVSRGENVEEADGILTQGMKGPPQMRGISGVANPNTPVAITISETYTVTLLHIPAIAVFTEVPDLPLEDHEMLSKQKARIEMENERYATCVEDHKAKDRYPSRGVQTVNESQRHKMTSTSSTMSTQTQTSTRTYVNPRHLHKIPTDTADKGCQAYRWDISDAFKQEAERTSASEQKVAASDAIAAAAAVVGHNPTGVSVSGIGGVVGGSSGQVSGMVAASSATGGVSTQMGSMATGTQTSSVVVSALSSAADAGSSDTSASHVLKALGQLPSFQQSLKVMERAVIQNTMHLRQQLYRDSVDSNTANELYNLIKKQDADAEAERLRSMAVDPDDAAEAETKESDSSYRKPSVEPVRSKSGAPKVQVSVHSEEAEAAARAEKAQAEAKMLMLWSFESPVTKGLSVTCMDWNKTNTDLLAVGYGSTEFGNQQPGIICLWTLKNPYAPEKIIHTRYGVTSLDFGGLDSPQYLAVGLYNGTVAIYDIRQPGDKAAMESTHVAGKHQEPVWQLKWVRGGINESGQHLVSVSTDGIVYQWAMKKGLQPRLLMALRRTPNPELEIFEKDQSYGGLDGVARRAGGMCFDFPSTDPSVYVCGTEDGLIHKCSVSYNEQTLENYVGHSGAVYKVKYSPFCIKEEDRNNREVFLSCSADWTCALWTHRQNVTKPVMVFKSQKGQDYIFDVCWSPHNSCVFTTVSRGGRLELWNIKDSPMDPIIEVEAPEKVQLTAVTFGRNAPVVLTGGSDGAVRVYRVFGVPLTSPSAHNNAVRLASHETATAGLDSAARAALNEISDLHDELEDEQEERRLVEEEARKLLSVVEDHLATETELSGQQPHGLGRRNTLSKSHLSASTRRIKIGQGRSATSPRVSNTSQGRLASSQPISLPQ